MIGYYNYSVILTYLSLGSAVYGVALSFSGKTKAALICLMVCCFCDAFDGTVARTCKRTEQEKSFGMHIDSLTDIVAFGALPAFIGLSLGMTKFVHVLVLFFYVLTALIRLAYFDVQEEELIKNDTKREYYLGLPVTLSALVIPALILLTSALGLPACGCYCVILILTGLAFITKFRLRKIYMPQLLIPVFLGTAVFALLLRFGGIIA